MSTSVFLYYALVFTALLVLCVDFLSGKILFFIQF